MQFFNLWQKTPEDTFNETQWREALQMRPMPLFNHLQTPSETAFDEAQWGEA